MNTVRYFAFFTLAIIIVFSCKKDQEIIGDTPTENSLTGLKTDTFTVETYSELSDSVPSSTGSIKFLGSYNSTECGNTTAKIFSLLTPSEIGQTIANGSVIQSVNLILPISVAYGTAINQEFEVFQSDLSLTADKTYYTFDSLECSSPAIGTFTLNSKDTGNFSFPLNHNLGTNLLSQGNSVLESEENFLNFFKGLVISPKASSASNSGVIYGINSSGIKIEIIFSNTDGNLVTTIDTVTLSQPSASKSFFQVKKDFTGSLVESGINNLTAGSELFYLQGIGGTKARINFPTLAAWYSNKYLINKATLILPIVNSSNSDFSSPPTLTFNSVSNSSTTGTPSTFDATTNSYKIDIHNKLTPDLEANATMSYNLSILNAYNQAEQLILKGNKNASNPAKLVIYYTNYK